MKAKAGWTVAVRDQSGRIQIRKEKLRALPKIFRLPILRGFISLFHALFIGVKALEYSANAAYEGAEVESKKEEGKKEEGAEDGGEDGTAGKKAELEKPLGKLAIATSMGLAMVLGVGLFILLPLYLTKLAGMALAVVAQSSLIFNFVDGVIRVIVFLAYVAGIGLWGEMKRVYQYHGAEHKVIHAFEAGRDLSPANVRDYSPLHPRCGTSFLLIVMVISILVFSFIPKDWSFLFKFLSRLVLMPLIAGLSYEFLKLSAKLKDNVFVRLMTRPGLLLQRLTTREPDDSQLEVAITALQEVLKIKESLEIQEVLKTQESLEIQEEKGA